MHIIVLSLLCLRLLDCSQQFVLSPFQVFVFAKSFCNVFRTILEAVQKFFTCIYRRMPCNQPKNCHQPCFPRDSPGAYKGGSVLALVAQIGPNQSLFSSFGQRNWHRHTRFGHKIFLCLAILSEIVPEIAVKVIVSNVSAWQITLCIWYQHMFVYWQPNLHYVFLDFEIVQRLP